MPQPISEALPSEPFDFAVAGSTALATLLSLLLAEAGKSVLRLRHRRAGQRLPPGIDLGLPLSVRPETWAPFATGSREVGELLKRTGAVTHLHSTTVRVETITPAWTDGLGHLVHLARAAGLSGEHVPHGPGQAFAFHRVPQLRADSLDQALAAAFEKLGVHSLDLDSLDAVDNGRVWIAGRPEPIIVRRTLLLDEPSIIRFAPAELWSSYLRPETVSTSLLPTARPLPAPIVISPEARVTLTQPTRGQLVSFTTGEQDADARLASRLSGPFPLKRLATRRSQSLRPLDGAPVLLLTDPSAHGIVAGLGDAAAFFAPSLARLLMGSATSPEQNWLDRYSGPARYPDLLGLHGEAA